MTRSIRRPDLSNRKEVSDSLQEQTGNPDFEHAACPLCGGSRSKEVFLSRDYNWDHPGLFRYVRCATCRLVYENPRPTPKGNMALYPHLYGTAISDPKEKPEGKINAAVHHVRSRAIESFAPEGPGSIFDIGCGSGFFLEYMRRRGWQVSGIDPSVEHVTYANKHLGLQDVHRGIWPPDQKLNHLVDVASLFHVIEHLLSPVQALSAVKRILRTDGILVLETPNIRSWPATLFGRRWVTLDAPRHVNLFSKDTLRYCLSKAGFFVLRMRTFSPSTMEYRESIRYLLHDWGLRQYRKDFRKPTEQENLYMEEGRSHRHSNGNSMKAVFRKSETGLFQGLNTLAALFGAGCNLLAVAQKLDESKTN